MKKNFIFLFINLYKGRKRNANIEEHEKKCRNQIEKIDFGEIGKLK